MSFTAPIEADINNCMNNVFMGKLIYTGQTPYEEIYCSINYYEEYQVEFRDWCATQQVDEITDQQVDNDAKAMQRLITVLNDC